MGFAALFPLLETARISACMESGTTPELNVSGCRYLTRLVLADMMVNHLSKPPQCTLRVEMVTLHSDGLEESQLRAGLAEVSEVLLSSKELYSPHGLVANAFLPNPEVIRCDRWDDLFDDDDSDDKDEGRAANVLVHTLRHSRNLPALKSILCGDYDCVSECAMKARVPAELDGVQELMFATDRPLRLLFESGRNVGEKLTTFCAVASEVRVDLAALRDMSVALSKRGLTLSMAQADPERKYAPSQCLYVHAASAPQLSYDDAVRSVNARVGGGVRLAIMHVVGVVPASTA